MSKQVYVDPKATRAPRTITFADIDVNKYQKAVKDELGNIPNADLVQIYKDMLYVREFETMIQNIKQTGAYQGTEYNHPGPAHLGIGQEAAYVARRICLPPTTIPSVRTEATARSLPVRCARSRRFRKTSSLKS